MENIKNLIEKLDDLSRQTLNEAASLCVAKSHYNIEIEHWLLHLLKNKSAIIRKALTIYNCNIEKITTDLHKNLSGLNSGNEQTPAIAVRLIELINAAWLVASLEFQSQYIDSGMILIALICDPILSQIAACISDEFLKVSSNTVKATIGNLGHDVEIDTVNRRVDKNNALKKYAINLNQQAQDKKIDAVIGREDEIRQSIDILSRRRQNNVILTGDPGVGKTAIVEGLALKIEKNDIPDILKGTIIYAVDMGALQAGASVKGVFEKRLKQLLFEVKISDKPIILFFDEAHALIGAGGQAGQNDAANLLKPALARGDLSVIAATTWNEYQQYFEKDAALTRRFQLVKVDEPDTETAISMLQSLVESLEKHHGVFILDNAIKKAVLLSQRYISSKKLPDKGISVLDTACARVASRLKETPINITKNEKKIELLKQALQRLILEKKQGISHKNIGTNQQLIYKIERENKVLFKQWNDEKKIIEKIISLRSSLANENLSKLTLNKIKKSFIYYEKQLKTIQKDRPLLQAFVNEKIISEVIADWTGIPIGHILKEQANQLLSLEKALSTKIIGQPYAIKILSEHMLTSSLKLTDTTKPMGVFLLLGPSGVGKTETALVLAESIFGSKENLITINMSEYKEAHKVSMLAGAPPGYIGYGEGGILTDAVKQNPYSLILLDEIDKAHPSMQDIFYQVFDKGILQDGQGRNIDFTNTIILMTANSCGEQIEDFCATQADIDMQALTIYIEDELLKIFKPAFLGRFISIPYLTLSTSVLKRIIQLKLQKLTEIIYKQYQLTPEFTDGLVSYLGNVCCSHQYGARLIDNTIQQQLLPAISKKFMSSILQRKRIKNLLVDYDMQACKILVTI